LVPVSGDDSCVTEFNGRLFVPNSKEESAFIASYLASLKTSQV
jgi:hypothetical protein